MARTAVTDVLQRVVFPLEPRPDALPLYYDSNAWSSIPGSTTQDTLQATARGEADADGATPFRLPDDALAATVTGRRSLEIAANSSISLASYFNAFPASYWQRHTALRSVRLSVSSTGVGTLTVYRSNARGVIQHVATRHLEGAATTKLELPLNSFIDGGWYWFDLSSGDEPLTLVNADWEAGEGGVSPPPHTSTVSITTMNRGDYCLALLAAFSADPDVLDLLDEVIVVDHGSERISANSRFAEIQKQLGGKLRVIEQGNIGGSGGFSRGMLETLNQGKSDSVLLLDDDLEVEPESIRRAITFSRFTSKPTIVGGHMFDMYDKSRLHAYAESVRMRDFMWGPVSPPRHDFSRSNLRQTAWVHRRFDSLYNGWWMSLIPVSVLKQIGLALPVFIKWDDAEFGIRAAAAGVPTVSLPGAAVWHVSWVDKDDSRDWQAFFHSRNRLVAALLHSSFAGGGRLPLSNFALDVRYLLSMDYYTVALRHEAYRSVLAGPDLLHGEMATRLPAIRELAKKYPESRPVTDLARFTGIESDVEPGAYGVQDGVAPRGAGALRWLVRQSLRHAFSRPAASAATTPQAHLPFSHAQWWVVPTFDSVLTTNAEGSGVTWHVRDPKRFRSLLWQSIRLNRRYRAAWRGLARDYRAALPAITSPGAWSTSLGLPDAGD